MLHATTRGISDPVAHSSRPHGVFGEGDRRAHTPWPPVHITGQGCHLNTHKKATSQAKNKVLGWKEEGIRGAAPVEDESARWWMWQFYEGCLLGHLDALEAVRDASLAFLTIAWAGAVVAHLDA